MSTEQRPQAAEAENDVRTRSRETVMRSTFSLPKGRVKVERPASTASREPVPRRAPAPRVSQAEHLSVKGQLHQQLLDEINQRGLLGAGEAELEAEVRDFVERVLQTDDIPLNEHERRLLAADLLEETLGVGPLAPLMADPAVTDILVNRYDQVYIERFGKLERTSVRFRDPEHLVRIIQRIAARVGRRIDETSPMVDARLRRREPRQRHAPAGDSRRSDPLDSPVRSPAIAARGPAAARHVFRRHVAVPRLDGEDAQERADLGRHRRRQIDVPGCLGGSDSQHRARRHDRGRRRIDPRPGARRTDGDATGERRRLRAGSPRATW